MEPINREIEMLGSRTLNAAFELHSELGPGLLESVYQECLTFILTQDGCKVEREVPIPIRFRGKELEVGFRADLILNGSVLVELKAVEALTPIHKAQTITYLKLSGIKLAFLLNFNEAHLKNGIRRIIHPDLLRQQQPRQRSGPDESDGK